MAPDLPAAPDGAREALAAALREAGFIPPFGPARVRDHETPESLRAADVASDQSNMAALRRVLAALAAEGYKVVKVNPTVADLAAEQGVFAVVDPASLSMADELSQEDRDAFLAGALSSRGGDMGTEFAVFGGRSMPRTGAPAGDAEHALFIAEEFGGEARQRLVGPWVPVSGEERNGDA